MKASALGLAFGALFGLASFSAVHASTIRPEMVTLPMGVTEVTWDTAPCKAGKATITTTARDTNGITYPVITPDVVLPWAAPGLLKQSWADIPPSTYTVSAVVRYDTGETFSSAIQSVIGLGTAPVPTPPPAPTPTVTPTPTPPAPGPAAWQISSPASGATISGIVTVTAPNPQPGSTAGFKVQLLTPAGALTRQSSTYNAQPTDTTFTVQIDVTTVAPGNYVLRGLFSLSVSADLPVTVVQLGPPLPTPTPPPTPSPTPTPPPGPTNADVIVAVQQASTATANALSQNTAALIAEIAKGFASMQPPVPPKPSCSGVINSLVTNNDGTQRLTSVKVPAGCGLAVGMSIGIIK